jgi:phosphoesterase RecJ-like protein
MWQSIIGLTLSGQKFVLTTHENSDGDGLGSESALADVLRQLGKTVSIINPTIVAKNYRFLFGENEVQIFDESPAQQKALAEADVIFVLDFNHTSRMRAIRNHLHDGHAAIVCIDHHQDPEPFADFSVCRTDAAATGELIYEFIKSLEAATSKSLLTKKSAEGLYTAIMTDTGSFRFKRTTPATHHLAAELLTLGVEPQIMYERIYEGQHIGTLKLIGTALETLTLTAGGRLGYLKITQETFKHTQTRLSDTERLTDYIMSLDGVQLGIMFIEMPEANLTKVSFRSKGEIAANELAARFHGGGHRNAAGCTIKLPYDQAIKAVLEAANDFLLEPLTIQL